MANIKYDAAKHAELISELNNIKENFEKVTTELTTVKETVSSDFKGDAATALQNALQIKIEQLNKEKENWGTVIENANQIEQAFTDSDNDAVKIVQGQDPYVQAKGGKIY